MMGIKHLSYLDLNEKARKEAASRARQSLRGSLTSPAVTAEQAASIQVAMNHIDKWEAGVLVPASPKKP